MTLKNDRLPIQVTSNLLINTIELHDPQLVNFLDLVFTLIEGATSDDPLKKMTNKQIQQMLFKMPILAMRSPVVLGLYNKFNEQIMGTVTFPTPESVVYGSDEPNGDLPSCEFSGGEDAETKGVEFDPEYGDEDRDDGYEPIPVEPPKATKAKK